MRNDKRNPGLDELAQILQRGQGGNNRQQEPEVVHLVDVIRHTGPGIQLPADLGYTDAAFVLLRKAVDEEQITNFEATIDASPYDGAYAFWQALDAKFGISTQKTVQTFFGPERRRIQIVINANGETVTVPWGEFEVPGVEGTFKTSYAIEDGRVLFQVTADIKGKYRGVFEELVALTREFIVKASIYRGKALHARFTKANGQLEEVPDIKFFDVSNAEAPIFNADLTDDLENDVLAYIRYPEKMKARTGTLKRGILLAGPYGTGKTLTAGYIARVATQHGFTFIYCTKAADIPLAYDFARLYQPAVIFAEDVDSVAGHDRDADVNRLLNKLDGVDSKGRDVIVVFTTNHIENINAAMLRPGRIDAILPIDPPDAETAIRIAQRYADGRLAPDANFSGAGQKLEGMIPAVIQEAVMRAEIRALGRTGGQSDIISPDDLVRAAEAVRREREIVKNNAKKGEYDEDAIRAAARIFIDEIGWSVENFGDSLRENGRVRS